MPLEVASALRFAAMRGEISSNIATSAYADLLSFQIELFPFGGLASRIWELRANVTTADAWYVALAEQLEAPLATLDGRLTRASGPRCAFVSPPEI
jgi:predicted nucleic acid-binding protein